MHYIRAKNLLNTVHLTSIPECILATFLYKDIDQVVFEDFVDPWSSPTEKQKFYFVKALHQKKTQTSISSATFFIIRHRMNNQWFFFYKELDSFLHHSSHLRSLELH